MRGGARKGQVDREIGRVWGEEWGIGRVERKGK